MLSFLVAAGQSSQDSAAHWPLLGLLTAEDPGAAAEPLSWEVFKPWLTKPCLTDLALVKSFFKQEAGLCGLQPTFPMIFTKQIKEVLLNYFFFLFSGIGGVTSVYYCVRWHQHSFPLDAVQYFGEEMWAVKKIGVTLTDGLGSRLNERSWNEMEDGEV